jgi:hypothetical protein
VATLFLAAHSIVGSQRLSRVSISRKTTSCSSISFSICSASLAVCASEVTAWPGIGTDRS